MEVDLWLKQKFYAMFQTVNFMKIKNAMHKRFLFVVTIVFVLLVLMKQHVNLSELQNDRK